MSKEPTTPDVGAVFEKVLTDGPGGTVTYVSSNLEDPAPQAFKPDNGVSWENYDPREDYQGNTPIYGSGRKSSEPAKPADPGRGELSRRESYGHDIYGPAIPFGPSKDGGPV